MDIEDLNKMQIILLTLLLSFVTSIATGIITVSMMNQAPPIITQTIHKVVEKTIETVTPEKNVGTVAEVITNNSDLIPNAVEKNSETLVRIIQKTEEGSIFSGLGVWVDKKGILVTSDKNIVPNANYFTIVGGKKIDLDFLKNNFTKQVSYLKAVDPDGTILKQIFKTVTYSRYDSLRLGQQVIVLGGVNNTEVSSGIISSFAQEKFVESTEATSSPSLNTKVLNYGVKINLPESAIIAGAPLLDVDGKIIGISTNPEKNIFTFLNFVKDDLQSISITKAE